MLRSMHAPETIENLEELEHITDAHALEGSRDVRQGVGQCREASLCK